MVLRRPIALCALAVLPALSACGSKPADVGDPGTAKKPDKLEVVKYPKAGMTFKGPSNWRRTPGVYPRVATLSSGEAVLAIFAYKRNEPAPPDKEALKTAKTRLLKQIKRRNKRYDVSVSRTRTIAGRPAIEVSGVQTLAGVQFKTRSVHIFKRNGEYVFEALAPRKQFDVLQKGVVKPVLTSIKLTGKVEEPPEPKKAEKKKPKEKKQTKDETKTKQAETKKKPG